MKDVNQIQSGGHVRHITWDGMRDMETRAEDQDQREQGREVLNSAPIEGDGRRERERDGDANRKCTPPGGKV